MGAAVQLMAVIHTKPLLACYNGVKVRIVVLKPFSLGLPFYNGTCIGTHPPGGELINLKVTS